MCLGIFSFFGENLQNHDIDEKSVMILATSSNFDRGFPVTMRLGHTVEPYFRYSRSASVVNRNPEKATCTLALPYCEKAIGGAVCCAAPTR